MGVDFYIRPQEEVQSRGIESHWHLTWGMMYLVLELFERAGVIDTETDGPILPPNVEKLDVETYERIYDVAHKRWAAEQMVRATSLDAIKVPAVKFNSNDGWVLTARECLMLAEVLRSVSLADIRAAFEADEENLKSWNVWGEIPEQLRQAVGERPSYEQHMSDLRDGAQDLGAFLERAAEFSGVRVR
jgi:hypothetical protein